MTKIINPKYKPHRGLPNTPTDVEWDALKAKVIAYLENTRGGDSTLTVADVRAVDDKLKNDLVWNQLSGELGLVVMPDPVPPE